MSDVEDISITQELKNSQASYRPPPIQAEDAVS